MTLTEKIAHRANISPSEVSHIASVACNEYSHFYIKKKNGKNRRICEPSTRLKRLQKIVADVVFSKFKVSKYSFAYERGNSIKYNAKTHRKATHIFKADIENFFPSISFEHIAAILSKKYNNDEINLIWQICSYEKGLPIGSPASPMIANRIMLKLDKQLAKAARGCKFTRYADDLTFSSKKFIDKRIEKNIDDLLRRNSFKINGSKCKFASINSGIHVTGLTISQEHKVTVGSKYKRKLKKLNHNYETKNIGGKNKLKGKQAFIDYIEN